MFLTHLYTHWACLKVCARKPRSLELVLPKGANPQSNDLRRKRRSLAALVARTGLPHDLDTGELVTKPYTRSKKAQRRLSYRIVVGGGMTRAELGDA